MAYATDSTDGKLKGLKTALRFSSKFVKDGIDGGWICTGGRPATPENVIDGVFPLTEVVGSVLGPPCVIFVVSIALGSQSYHKFSATDLEVFVYYMGPNH